MKELVTQSRSLLGNCDSRHGLGPTGVVSKMQDEFLDLSLGDPIIESPLQVKRELLSVSTDNESRECFGTPITLC